MMLYLYNVADKKMICELDVVRVLADCVVGTDGYTRAVQDGYDYSSKADLSEALCAEIREKNPSTEKKVEQMEEILAEMLFGGGQIE